MTRFAASFGTGLQAMAIFMRQSLDLMNYARARMARSRSAVPKPLSLRQKALVNEII